MENNIQEKDIMEIDIIDNGIMEEENTFVENKKVLKRNIVLYISIALIIVSIAFRASYAFFSATVTNTNTPSSTTVTSGELNLEFDNNVNILNVQNLGLMTAEAAASATNNYSTFTITNTGSVAGKYKLYLTNYSITENLVNADFKYKLTIDGNTYSGTFYDLFNGKTATNGIIASGTDNISLLSSDITIASGASHNCELRVWIQEENHNQIGLTEGTLRTSIRLIATSS